MAQSLSLFEVSHIAQELMIGLLSVGRRPLSFWGDLSSQIFSDFYYFIPGVINKKWQLVKNEPSWAVATLHSATINMTAITAATTANLQWWSQQHAAKTVTMATITTTRWPMQHAQQPATTTTIVKTLQGLGMLDVSVVAVGARVQWFNGSMVKRRA